MATSGSGCRPLGADCWAPTAVVDRRALHDLWAEDQSSLHA